MLGLGTLWKDLLKDEIYPVDQPVQPKNSPYFVGHAARSVYSALTGGGGTIPVEDGSYDGLSNQELSLGEGMGSVDCHWKERVFDNELMTPVLSAGRNPLSLLSLKSLEDIGYSVDTSRVDAYSLPTMGRASIYSVKQESSSISMHGDVFRCPTLEEGLRKARNRERMGRRLRSKAFYLLREG